ncbi:MAG: YceI family protein [Deltaproteobacteria bacterium]|nr:YceI family protein [Deltaproteobacteria bacterium]
MEVPVFDIPTTDSTINFYVKASVAIEGSFDRWNANLRFASRDARTGVLNIRVQADSVDTGSNIKNSTLEGKDFFDVRRNPFITFTSTKIVQTGPDTFDVDGDFAIRGVSKGERLTLTVFGAGTGSGEIKGTMAFDRKDYGMNSSIPFIRIANRVEVRVNLKVKRVSGPPLVFKR